MQVKVTLSYNVYSILWVKRLSDLVFSRLSESVFFQQIVHKCWFRKCTVQTQVQHETCKDTRNYSYQMYLIYVISKKCGICLQDVVCHIVWCGGSKEEQRKEIHTFTAFMLSSLLLTVSWFFNNITVHTNTFLLSSLSLRENISTTTNRKGWSSESTVSYVHIIIF